MVTRVISLTLRNLYYTSPTNTNPLRRVSWRPLGVLYLTDMLNAFFGRATHDLTIFEGALKPWRKGEICILFNGGCSPGPWVQVNSVTRQFRHVWLPRHMATMSRRHVVVKCCQVQTPYLEIFDFSVFPIFTDNWGCTICANCE